ncbi:MAG: hypothetical protein ACRDOL_33385 [Streptosporangiaceae bacterium]
MSSFFRSYRRGLIGIVAGVGFLGYGAVIGGKFALLGGLAALLWGVFRFRTAKR